MQNPKTTNNLVVGCQYIGAVANSKIARGNSTSAYILGSSTDILCPIKRSFLSGNLSTQLERLG